MFIWSFLTCLLNLVIDTLVQFYFVIIIISVDDEQGNFKLYFLKDSHLKMFS